MTISNKHIPIMSQATERRFWDCVDTQKSDGCWPWLGKVNVKGYGYLPDRQGGVYLAHRIAYVLAKGHIPESLLVLHSCPGKDNPACCNPAHLRIGTASENARDREIRK